MAAPTVSVIMPIYNVAPYVRAAVESVLAQSWRDFELIAVDDESSDGTPEQLAGIDDPRVRVIRQKHAGSAAARNRGLREARGRYVAFLDGDDLWLPGKLKAQVEWLEGHPRTDLVFTASRVVDESGEDAGRATFGRPGTVSFPTLLVEDVIGNGSSAMLRREAIDTAGWFDTRLVAGADHDLWLRTALLREHNIHGLPHTLTLYRRRQGQESADWRVKRKAWDQILTKMERLAPRVVTSVRDEADANLLRVVSCIAYENGELAEAARLFGAALRRSPAYILSDRRSWLQATALAAAVVLPRRLHRIADRRARRLRTALRRSLAAG
jgi:glycosyltransferase involved in cell wall biosynthesis